MSTKHPFIHWQQCDTATLLGSYNLAARALGKPEVKRFSDRKAAVNRTYAIWNEYGDHTAKAEKAQEIKAVHTPGVVHHFELNEAGKAPLAHADAAKDAIATHPQAATPTPPVAEKKELWRRPKRVEPSRTAYRPRASSLQTKMYHLLTQPGGIRPEDFCRIMNPTVKPGGQPWIEKGLWSILCYLFVSQKGYGLRFDGEHIELLVPKDERDQAKRGAA